MSNHLGADKLKFPGDDRRLDLTDVFVFKSQADAEKTVPIIDSAKPISIGKIRLFAGLRSDPFFADVEGALHGLEWTGHDDFAQNNVDCIALEVPNEMLGAGLVVGVQAIISRRRDEFPYLGVPNP